MWTIFDDKIDKIIINLRRMNSDSDSYDSDESSASDSDGELITRIIKLQNSD
jgi:hypothetical protein